MISKKYQEAATETLEILKNTNDEDVNKIPKKFIKFLQENCSKTYKPLFDTTKPIEELKLRPETEALLQIIYINCWANKRN